MYGKSAVDNMNCRNILLFEFSNEVRIYALSSISYGKLGIKIGISQNLATGN